MDEGHKVKSYRTRSARAIQFPGARRLIFLSATPMLNRVFDLHGLLRLLWRPEFCKKNRDPVLDDFKSIDVAALSLSSVNELVFSWICI